MSVCTLAVAGETTSSSSEAPQPPVIMKSSSAAAASLLAGSLCPGPASVLLRPDATYVQLGDVDVPGARCVRIVHISDTPQGRREDLPQLIPDGDVLVHSGGLEGSSSGCGVGNGAGDSGGSGSSSGGTSGGGGGSSSSSGSGSILAQPLEPLFEQRHLRRLRDFLAALPHRHKVLVPASRDARLHRFASGRSAQELQRKLGPCHYLHDSSVTLEGVTFYGVPGHSACPNGRAKGRRDACGDDSDAGSEGSWQKVPQDVDVLVAHSPRWDQHAHEAIQRVRPKAVLHGQVGFSENGAHWRDGVLVSNGSLAKVSRPVVIDFYTSRPDDNDREYSEIMEVTSRLKRAEPASSCALM